MASAPVPAFGSFPWLPLMLDSSCAPWVAFGSDVFHSARNPHWARNWSYRQPWAVQLGCCEWTWVLCKNRTVADHGATSSPCDHVSEGVRSCDEVVFSLMITAQAKNPTDLHPSQTTLTHEYILITHILLFFWLCRLYIYIYESYENKKHRWLSGSYFS